MTFFQKSVRVELLVMLVVSALIGGLSGAITALSVRQTESLRTSLPTQTTTTVPIVLPVTPTTTFSLIPVERRRANAFVPPAELAKRASSVVSVYRRPKGTGVEDRVLDQAHLLGEAVALTADGWFVTSASVFGLTGTPLEIVRYADAVIWYDGKTYAVDRGVVDHLNGTVYFKTAVSDLTPQAFAHLSDLDTGSEVWIEPRSRQFAPDVVLDVRARVTPNQVQSSEIADRRIILRGVTLDGDVGSAVWDPSGSLVGIVDSRKGESVRVVPASSISASFTSLLANGDIRHALLGVRAVDLSTLRSEGTPINLPHTGAWIRDDKKTGKLGIVPNSPAAKVKLKDGDVILGVDRDILDGTADLGEILSEYRPETSVALRIFRDGKDMDVKVDLGSVVTSEALK